MNASTPEWVFLDAGDTFVYGYPTFYDAVEDCWKDIGVPIERKAIVDSAKTFFASRGQGELVSQERFETYFRGLYAHVLRDLKFSGDVDAYVDRLWGEWRSGHRLRLFDDAESALNTLAQRGIKLGIVSNWDDSFEAVMRRLEVWDLFDVRINSVAVGFAKPDPRIFQHALNQAGASVEQCWFVGDQVPNDIEPAKALGMKSVLVDYFGKAKPEAASIADHVVPCISLAALKILGDA